MRFRPSIRGLGFCAALAVCLHAAAAAWWVASASPRTGLPASRPAAAITVVTVEQRAVAETKPAPTTPPEPEDVARSVRVETPAATQELEQHRSVEPSRPQPAAVTVAPSTGAEAIEPAYLAGEPLINLTDDDVMVDGSMRLRLTIDEAGEVVDSRVTAREGLTDNAVATFVRLFSGYDYVPARRAGRPIRSEATMLVRIRDGQGATGLVP